MNILQYRHSNSKMRRNSSSVIQTYFNSIFIAFCADTQQF